MTTQNTSVSEEREKFHAYMQQKFPAIDLTLRADGTYWELHDDSWDLWQAARATPAPSVPLGGGEGDWGVDTSTGRPVLVHKNCRVIESEEAFYVLRLITEDRSRADAIQAQDAAPAGGADEA